MSTYFLTHVRIEADNRPEDVVNRVVSLLRPSADLARFARVKYREGCSWLRIEHLGFYSLKQKAVTEIVARLAGELNSEVLMLAAQTTATCAAYAHYVGGSLQRFLSSGEDRWFEIYGQPEPWERELFSKEFEWNYLLGEGTGWIFCSRVVFRIAGLIGLLDADRVVS